MKKLKIGLCDDELLVLKQLERLIRECFADSENECELFLFESGKEILKTVKELDAVFLDIEMPDMDGIETGRLIQRMNPKCRIIIATGKIERFKEAFKFQAYRFVTKPFEKEEIKEALDAIIENGIMEKTIELYHDRISYMINEQQIRYIEAYDGSAEVVVEKCRFAFRKDTSLDELQKILNAKTFFRVHKKYLVNMRWILGYKEQSGIIKMQNKEFKIARRRKAEFEKAFLEFDINYR